MVESQIIEATEKKEKNKLYMREYRKKMSVEKKKEIQKKQSEYYINIWYKQNREKSINGVKEWREKQKAQKS